MKFSQNTKITVEFRKYAPPFCMVKQGRGPYTKSCACNMHVTSSYMHPYTKSCACNMHVTSSYMHVSPNMPVT